MKFSRVSLTTRKVLALVALIVASDTAVLARWTATFGWVVWCYNVRGQDACLLKGVGRSRKRQRRLARLRDCSNAQERTETDRPRYLLLSQLYSVVSCRFDAVSCRFQPHLQRSVRSGRRRGVGARQAGLVHLLQPRTVLGLDRLEGDKKKRSNTGLRVSVFFGEGWGGGRGYQRSTEMSSGTIGWKPAAKYVADCRNRAGMGLGRI